MTTMIRCAACGADQWDSVKFCSECGASRAPRLERAVAPAAPRQVVVVKAGRKWRVAGTLGVCVATVIAVAGGPPGAAVMLGTGGLVMFLIGRLME